MKKTLVYLLLLTSAGILRAQTPISVDVVNTKGKSLGNKAIVWLKSHPASQSPEKNALLTLRPVAGDTIFVTVGNFMGSIPADGLRELTVVADKGKMSNQATGAEYQVIKRPTFNPTDIAGTPNIHMFRDLENLVATKFPTVRIQQNQAFLMSIQTPTSSQSMLILVDGNPMQNFAQANETISVQQIKSIVIKRSDPLYGLRGAGGIMEITLLNGRDR